MDSQQGAIFNLMYFLYSRTPIGQWYTRRSIRQARIKYPDQHSQTITHTYGEVTVQVIPNLDDNLSYIITMGNDMVLIDIGDALPVLNALKGNTNVPIAVLSTHHHWDHTNGNSELRKRFPQIQVMGSKRVHAVTRVVKHGEVLCFGDQLKCSVHCVPGHTRDHLIYRFFFPNQTNDFLFSGDFLFYCGMGKLFEGTAMEMLTSLDSLYLFADSSVVFSGHEYAHDNLQFALSMDPNNSQLLTEQLSIAQSQRKQRLPMIPSTLSIERRLNPFLRTARASLRLRLGLVQSNDHQQDEHLLFKQRSEALRMLRHAKDRFQPLSTSTITAVSNTIATN